MEFAAIDFETATSARDSACSVAVSVVKDGRFYDAFYSLIRPKDMRFDDYNIRIHGIRPEDVRDKPNFAAIWQDLKRQLDGRIVVAHNASFDMGVLRACIQSYDLAAPRFDYLCTVKLSRRLWPELENHRLNTLGEHFGIRFRHHNALDDARVCARLAYLALQECHARDLYDLSMKLSMRPTAFRM